MKKRVNIKESVLRRIIQESIDEISFDKATDAVCKSQDIPRIWDNYMFKGNIRDIMELFDDLMREYPGVKRYEELYDLAEELYNGMKALSKHVTERDYRLEDEWIRRGNELSASVSKKAGLERPLSNRRDMTDDDRAKIDAIYDDLTDDEQSAYYRYM